MKIHRHSFNRRLHQLAPPPSPQHTHARTLTLTGRPLQSRTVSRFQYWASLCKDAGRPPQPWAGPERGADRKNTQVNTHILAFARRSLFYARPSESSKRIATIISKYTLNFFWYTSWFFWIENQRLQRGENMKRVTKSTINQQRKERQRGESHRTHCRNYFPTQWTFESLLARC